MTAQVRAISMRDAYFLTYLAACVGPPLVVRGLLGLLSARPGQDALSHALEFAAKTLPLYDQKAQGTYRLLFETTAEYGLVIPTEPTTAIAYESFLQITRSVISRAVSASQNSAVSAAYDAGTASGDLHLSLYVGRTLFYLRPSAPEEALLATAAGNVARTLCAAQKRLAEALRHSAWPAAVVEIGRKLEALFISPPRCRTGAVLHHARRVLRVGTESGAATRRTQCDGRQRVILMAACLARRPKLTQ